MTITEFIAKLEQLRAEHGDLEVTGIDREGYPYRACPEVRDAGPYDRHAGDKVVRV